MTKGKIATIGITMGDPAGIGPEIILKSFANPVIRKNRIVILGDFNVMQAAHHILKVSSFSLLRITGLQEVTFSPDVLNILDLNLIDIKDFTPGIVNPVSGKAAYLAIHRAVELAVSGEIDAVVTAPLNKEALHKAGYKYPGHTEILASLSGSKDYAMLLYHNKLKVIHVSTHVSLLEAINGLTRERIEKVIELADKTMIPLCRNKPRIAVAGINPHSGENGLFGNEELDLIIPAVKNMRNKGFNVEGPFPPDTVFLNTVKGRFDIVVAMYHDQGHIPLKLLGFERGVNVTTGLPFIRTSVDHGTAFDIAWKGTASERSMIEAIKLALRLSRF
jgi:4-hydroxythreonine-4-phosphate dehydrogenase